MPRRKRSWSFSRRKIQVEIDEGYVKFSLSMTDGDIPKHPDWEKLNEARGSLHQLGLIGTYPNGIGFGNASMRNSGLEFIITGTATGGIPILRETDYCLVQSFELEKNQVRATGRTKASSESMTHGAIYSADESIRCVLHFHSRKIFDSMLLDGTVPRTKKEVEYGTPRMAIAMDQIVRSSTKNHGFFATEGHDEGVFAYGPSIEEALEQTYFLLRKFG